MKNLKAVNALFGTLLWIMQTLSAKTKTEQR